MGHDHIVTRLRDLAVELARVVAKITALEN
jgi:hypothetical protein